jgi:hypothetical protein
MKPAACWSRVCPPYDPPLISNLRIVCYPWVGSVIMPHEQALRRMVFTQLFSISISPRLWQWPCQEFSRRYITVDNAGPLKSKTSKRNISLFRSLSGKNSTGCVSVRQAPAVCQWVLS